MTVDKTAPLTAEFIVLVDQVFRQIFLSSAPDVNHVSMRELFEQLFNSVVEFSGCSSLMLIERSVPDQVHPDDIPVEKSFETITQLLVVLLIIEHMLHFLNDLRSYFFLLSLAPTQAVFT